MDELFQKFFIEMIETIAHDMSLRQKNFLRFILRDVYETKTKQLLETYLTIQADPTRAAELLSITNNIRLAFNLIPYNAKPEDARLLGKRHARFNARWKELATLKGVE